MVDRLVNTEVNAKRMKNVEDCFGATGQPLCKTGRVLVGEGVLTKLCRKKPKPRQFFLFNDILVYGNIVINKKMYNKQHILPLEEVKIVALEDDGNFKNGWQIISPSKSFAVYAATPTEKAEWMAHIDKCIKDVLKKTGKTPSGDEAAVWVPDQSASVCMLCNKTKFTPIVRRHHCRRCGSVVCGSCSNKKYLIPHISSKPVRVCNRCYEQLSTGQMKPDDPVTVGPGQKFKPGDASSLTRKESEKIAESGSSAEEDSEEEEEKSEENEPKFYGGGNSNDSVPTEVSTNSSNSDVEMATPTRPSEAPVTENHHDYSNSHVNESSSSYSSGGGGGGSSGGDHDSSSGGGGGGGGGGSMDD